MKKLMIKFSDEFDGDYLGYTNKLLPILQEVTYDEEYGYTYTSYDGDISGSFSHSNMGHKFNLCSEYHKGYSTEVIDLEDLANKIKVGTENRDFKNVIELCDLYCRDSQSIDFKEAQ